MQSIQESREGKGLQAEEHGLLCSQLARRLICLGFFLSIKDAIRRIWGHFPSYLVACMLMWLHVLYIVLKGLNYSNIDALYILSWGAVLTIHCFG